MSRPLAPVLAVLASVALASCGDSAPEPKAPVAGGGKGGGAAAGAILGKKMPEFTPSGIKEDYKKWKEAKDAVKHARVKEEKAAAEQAQAALKTDLEPKWSGRDVPAPEAHYLATLLSDFGKYSEAATQCRRWLDVAPDDNPNYVHTTTLLISCLASAGDYDGAQRELKANKDTTYRNKEQQYADVQTTIALIMLKNGKLELALENFESCLTANVGDLEAGMLAIEIAQRLGKPQEAVRIAQKAADHFTGEGRSADRAKQLLQEVQLIGKPAPGFAAAKWWQGVGGPVTPEMLKGKVTVVFSWNMKSAWNTYFFERLHGMLKDYAERGMQLVGISRLAHFDPLKMGTKKDMTDDEELKFFEMWTQQYGVTYPLAVDGFESEALMGAWAAHTVPFYAVVGRDGNVFGVAFGKDEERIQGLRQIVDLALAK